MRAYKKNIIVSIYIAIFSVFIPAIFWLSSGSKTQQNQKNTVVSPTPKKEALPEKTTTVETTTVSKAQSKIEQRIGLGEKILIAADRNPQKQAAARAFAAGNYQSAIIGYEASLEVKRNDPEAWIYKNNAEAFAAGDFVRIAVAVPIGGNLNVAKEMLRGVAQVQEEVNNNGGIQGKLLQITIANDDNQPEISQQIARHLSQDKQILGVVGHNSTEASMAAAEIYQQAQLLMISPTTVGNGLSNIGDYIFRTTPDTRSTADILAHHVVKSDRLKKVAICFASDAKASQSFKDAFEWSIFQAGGTLINIDCDFSKPDFDPANISTRAISHGADALVLNPSIYNIDDAIAVVQANNQRLPLLGNQTMYVYETLQRGLSDANGMTLSVAWHPATNSDDNSDDSFTQTAKNFWGGSVGWRTAMAYDAAKAIVMGLESSSTRQQLQEIISNSDFAFNGATGIVNFLPSGDRNLRGTLVKVVGGNKSGVGYDFVSVKDTSVKALHRRLSTPDRAVSSQEKKQERKQITIER